MTEKTGVVPFAGASLQESPRPGMRTAGPVGFDRRELSLILNVYGKKVAADEWRDYALDMLRDRALFSIYKRSAERPLYVIEKDPRLARRQGQYRIVNADGRVMKRGHDLASVLRVLDPQLFLVR